MQSHAQLQTLLPSAVQRSPNRNAVLVQAVKALRFDPAAHKQKVPETEEARQERVKAEAELAKALEEADEEDGM